MQDLWFVDASVVRSCRLLVVIRNSMNSTQKTRNAMKPATKSNHHMARAFLEDLSR